MEKFFLILLFAAELLLMAFRLRSGSRQVRASSFVRLSAFAVFSASVLLGVIHWGFRWYALAVLLLLWAAMGIASLRHPARPRAAFHPRREIAGGAARCLLVGIAMLPAVLFPQYQRPSASGPYAVAYLEDTWIDEHRINAYAPAGEPLKLNVAFWYPQDAAGVFPLVVFSHGGLSTKSSNTILFAELASQGYIVCSIDHPYQSLWTVDADGRTAFISREYLRETMGEDAKTDRQGSYALYQKWMALRSGDIHFALETILGRASGDPRGVYALVDVERIGLMGHSLGGSAVLGIPRQRDDIDAVIALESPFLSDIQGVENGAFMWTGEAYPVPVLNIYSDSAWGHLAEWPQYAMNARLLSSPAASQVSLHLPGRGHFSLSDLSLASPLLVRMLEGEGAADSLEYLLEVNQACLEFFNRYLKG